MSDESPEFQSWSTTMAKLGSKPGADSVLYVDPGDHQNPEHATDIMICDVCDQSLTRFISGAGETWVHARSWMKHDHEPVPRAVPLTERHGQLCDFCGQDRQTYWKFVGERLRHGSGNTVHDYGTAWGACDICSTMVKNGDLESLLERVMRISPLAKTRNPAYETRIRIDLINMWTTFLGTVHTEVYVGPKREPAKLHPRMMPKIQMGLVKFWKSQGLLEQLTAGRRAAMQNHGVPGLHAGHEDEFVVRYGPTDVMPDQVWKNHTDHLSAGIMVSELIWISSAFTQLATMAGQDLEKLLISREELPEKFGLMIYEQPIGEIPRPGGMAAIRAVSWTLVPGGIWLNLYLQGEDADPDVDVEQMRSELGYLMCPNPGVGFAFDHELPVPDDDAFSFITTIFATWFLMKQPGVAESSSAPVDKKLARAFQRSHNRRLPEVRLVDLRRQPTRSHENTSTGEGRQLTVRIYRRGHWKRQFYGPGRALRKTIYVSAYIAGPDDAPLKERPRVVKVLR